jgi:hypothetical protein
MRAFHIDIDSVAEGVKMMGILAEYDQFQLDNNIKPDYCNTGGIIMFDPEDHTDGPDGSWVDFWSDEALTDDPWEYLEWEAAQ